MDTTQQLRNLAPPQGEPWRRREAQLFALVQALADGDLPAEIESLDAYQRRVLGYLAETAALQLPTAHRAALLALARCCRAGLDITEPALLLPARDPERPHHDDIAQAWNVVPPIDLGRLRADLQRMDSMT